MFSKEGNTPGTPVTASGAGSSACQRRGASSCCRVSVCPKCGQHGPGATRSSASPRASVLRDGCAGWARCLHFPNQWPETPLAPGDLCISRVDCPQTLFKKERPGQWIESNRCLRLRGGEWSVCLCDHGHRDGRLRVEIPVPGDHLERVVKRLRCLRVWVSQGDPCWLTGETALCKVPKAGLERKPFPPPVSYSGCLLWREVVCALTGGCLSPVSAKGKRRKRVPLLDLRVLSLADGSGN